VALAQAKHSAAGTPAVLDDREFIEAVLWLARTGSPWRDLPGVFGKWYAMHTRFLRDYLLAPLITGGEFICDGTLFFQCL
jgi:transposase